LIISRKIKAIELKLRLGIKNKN